MSDTSKATPWRIGTYFDPKRELPHVNLVTGDGVRGIDVFGDTLEGAKVKAIHILAVLNSYSPERDKLARELAEDIISSHKAYNQPSQSMPMRESDWVEEIDKARQLLKLYEEDK